MAELMNCWGEFPDLMSKKAEDIAPVKISKTAIVKFKYPPFGLVSVKNGKITNLMIFPEGNSALPAIGACRDWHVEGGE